MTNEIKVTVPDIGGASQVDVIEILVKVGDVIDIDTPLITLESDKASMEIPSPVAGVVSQLKAALGDKLSEGDLILLVQQEQSQSHNEPVVAAVSQEAEVIEQVQAKQETTPVVSTSAQELPPALNNDDAIVFAGPAVRRMARELGVDLSLLQGSGRKSRVTKEDIQKYVATRLAESPSVAVGLNVTAGAVIDFSKFGDIETKALNKIKRATATNVHRSWVTIPHVTQFDEADITDLEAFRKQEAERAKQADYKLTLLAFVCKVVSKALQVFPQFNASLDASGENLIYKKYCNIGIAVETPNGLVVPVIKHVDQLTVVEIAQEMGRLSAKARDKGLMPADMSGGCFTISSLGGIGGTAFTPIVNAPEVAILGLSRSSIKPVYVGDQFLPKLMLPLSLSYDHRVIDGAEAARFTRYLCDCLSDIRKILL